MGLETLSQNLKKLNSWSDEAKTVVEVLDITVNSIKSLSKASAFMSFFGVALDVVEMVNGEKSDSEKIMEMIDDLQGSVNNFRSRMETLFESEDTKDQYTALKNRYQSAIDKLQVLKIEVDTYLDYVFCFASLELIDNSPPVAEQNDEQKEKIKIANGIVYRWNRNYNWNNHTNQKDRAGAPNKAELQVDIATKKRRILDAYDKEGLSEYQGIIQTMQSLGTNSDDSLNILAVIYDIYSGNLDNINMHGALLYNSILDTIFVLGIVRGLQKERNDPAFNYDSELRSDTDFFNRILLGYKDNDGHEQIGLNDAFKKYQDMCILEVWYKEDGEAKGNIRKAAKEVLERLTINESNYVDTANQLAILLEANFKWLSFTVIVYDGYEDRKKNFGTAMHYFNGSVNSDNGFTTFLGFDKTANNKEIHVLIRWVNPIIVPSLFSLSNSDFNVYDYLDELFGYFQQYVEKNGNSPFDLQKFFGNDPETGLKGKLNTLLLETNSTNDGSYDVISKLYNSTWWFLWDDQTNPIGISSIMDLKSGSNKIVGDTHHFTGAAKDASQGRTINKDYLKGKRDKEYARNYYMEPGYKNNGNVVKSISRTITYYYNGQLGYIWMVMS